MDEKPDDTQATPAPVLEKRSSRGDTPDEVDIEREQPQKKQKAVKKGAGKSRKQTKEERRGTTRRGTRPDSPTNETRGDDSQPKSERLPKRPCALLIGFCGEGYRGMQIQPEGKTIENVLFDALVKTGAVSKDNADDPVKVKINRAARTDAGVHAAGNLVSMKLIIDIPGVPDLVTRVNEELPPEIRVWNYVRTRNSFAARSACDSRKYTYFFPSYLLIPPKPGSGMYKNTFGLDTEEGTSSTPVSHTFWESSPTGSIPAEDLLRKRQWRVGPEELARLREFARKFEGTHNFHNFTVGREAKEKSCTRFMKSVEVADPAVYGETEWISVLLHGQSFMLHQIRKMICVMILACRTNTPLQVVEELFGPRNVLAPKMPALGLLLEYPIFDSYNRKIAVDNEKMSPADPNYRLPIDFERHRDAIEQFKQQFIYTRVRATELQVPIFDEWIRSIDKYAGGDLLYFGPRGSIPPEAVITPGVRRDNPFREKRKFDAVKFAEGEASVDIDAEGEEGEEDEEENLNNADLAEMEG